MGFKGSRVQIPAARYERQNMRFIFGFVALGLILTSCKPVEHKTPHVSWDRKDALLSPLNLQLYIADKIEDESKPLAFAQIALDQVKKGNPLQISTILDYAWDCSLKYPIETQLEAQ